LLAFLFVFNNVFNGIEEAFGHEASQLAEQYFSEIVVFFSEDSGHYFGYLPRELIVLLLDSHIILV
jgi:hypothetical protein